MAGVEVKSHLTISDQEHLIARDIFRVGIKILGRQGVFPHGHSRNWDCESRLMQARVGGQDYSFQIKGSSDKWETPTLSELDRMVVEYTCEGPGCVQRAGEFYIQTNRGLRYPIYHDTLPTSFQETDLLDLMLAYGKPKRGT